MENMASKLLVALLVVAVVTVAALVIQSSADSQAELVAETARAVGDEVEAAVKRLPPATVNVPAPDNSLTYESATKACADELAIFEFLLRDLQRATPGQRQAIEAAARDQAKLCNEAFAARAELLGAEYARPSFSLATVDQSGGSKPPQPIGSVDDASGGQE